MKPYNRTEKEEKLIKDIVYPSDWTDCPSRFSIIERTSFSDGSFEIIISDGQYDIRISKHEERYSTTVRINNAMADYMFKDKSKFNKWLNNIYSLPEFRFAFIDHNIIKGFYHKQYVYIKNEGIQKVQSPTLLSTCSNIDKNVENPKFGSLIMILVDKQKNNYIYVYRKLVIEISTHIHIKQNVFPIPSLDVVYNSMKVGELENYSIIYFDNSIDKDRLLSVSI